MSRVFFRPLFLPADKCLVSNLVIRSSSLVLLLMIWLLVAVLTFFEECLLICFLFTVFICFTVLINVPVHQFSGSESIVCTLSI